MKDIKKLLKKSVTLQKQANRVVKDTKVQEIFSKLGKINFIGSYKLRLMMRRDIDIIVTSNKPSVNKANLITKKLKALRKFSSVRMIDSYTKRLPYLPQGFYWELKIRKPEGEWKFDVWYLSPKEDKSIASVNKWKKLLTSAKKNVILAVKNKYLRTKMLYSNKLYGAKIYKAILERGIKDLESFHKRVASSKRHK